MLNQEKYTEILQWHNAIEHFDYDPAIDWAIEMIRDGIETENVLIVASFSKPVDRYEIKPYITGALNELNLMEKYGEHSIIANSHYYLEQILNDYDIRKNLTKLYKICLNGDMDSRLMPFYLLYHGWDGLEQIGANYYFEGATLDNIEEIIKEQAKIWIDIYIHGKEIEEKDEVKLGKLKQDKIVDDTNNTKTEKNENSLWELVKKLWNKK